MQSIIKSLEVCVLDGKLFVTGYALDVKDNLPEDILQYLVPASNGYITPAQMYYFLACMGDDVFGGNGGVFKHKMDWYEYSKDIFYPNLSINGVLCTRYNIPVNLIEVDSILDPHGKKGLGGIYRLLSS